MKNPTKHTILIVTALTLLGCGGGGGIPESTASTQKELLTSHDWYEVESCEDTYSIHSYSNNTYLKVDYADETFVDATQSTTATITSYTEAGVDIILNDATYHCAVSSDTQEGWIMPQCSKEGSSDPLEDILFTAWKTKELVREHRDSKCE